MLRTVLAPCFWPNWDYSVLERLTGLGCQVAVLLSYGYEVEGAVGGLDPGEGVPKFKPAILDSIG